MDLNQAVQAHAEWKLKFRSAISRHEQMDVVTISRDDCCNLGKWLHGEAKAKFSKLDSFAQCVEKHAHFHKEAARIAEAINAKKYDAASTMLDAGTAYTAASNAVGAAIIHLKREANL